MGTHALVVGYADSGRILKLLVRDTVVIDYVMPEEPPLELAFIGEKQRQVSLAALYRAGNPPHALLADPAGTRREMLRTGGIPGLGRRYRSRAL